MLKQAVCVTTMNRFTSNNFVLVLLLAALLAVSNVSAFLSENRGGRPSTFVLSSTTFSPKSQSSVAEPEIAHLQKKLKYWKGQEIAKQDEFQKYILEANIASKAKPIYKRVGKIDTYTSRPVFDQETTRIQTEVWSIKEKIKLTQAKLEEEKRIQRVTEEMAHRLSQQDAEIRSVREEEKVEQERIRKEAEEKVLALQAQSTARLTEKEQEIDTLAKDIDNLSKTLQEKRSQLQTKESDLLSLSNTLQDKRSQLRDKEAGMTSLQAELEAKETILHNLNRERASLRCLVRQSWRVLKTRVKKRLPHREHKSHYVAPNPVMMEVTGDTKVSSKADDRVLVQAR